MGNIVENFCTVFQEDDIKARKREEHYQLTRSKNTRLSENVQELLNVFEVQGIKFCKSSEKIGATCKLS